MKTGIKIVLLSALVAIASVSCKKEKIEPDNVPQKPEAGIYQLALIETSDIHGTIVETDTGGNHFRMAYVADKVKDIRGHGTLYSKERLLLLDGGDIYQGTAFSNLQLGKPVSIAMDMMGYDAVTVGNHDFDWGFEETVDPDGTLREYERGGRQWSNEVPVVCANLYQNGSRTAMTKDYVIVEKTAVNSKGGTVKVKVGIVGFALDYSSSILASQFAGKGYSISENYSTANGIAAELEASGRCDATILLTHGEAEWTASQLGEGSAFDLVLGGHTHVASAGQTEWGLVYAQTGPRLENYAFANLKFCVDDDGNVSFLSVGDQQTVSVDDTRNIHTYEGQNAEDLDSDILSLSNEALASVNEEFAKVIGYIDSEASTYYIAGSSDRASNMSNWMCDITCRIGEANVAFVNSGGVRTYISRNGQPTRDFTVADIYEIFPFNNKIYVFSLTYAELLRIFEYSMTSTGMTVFSHMTGIDCRFTRSEEQTSSSGTTYRTYAVHSLTKDGTVIYQDNTWVGDWASRSVTVAVSEFVATTLRADSYTGLANPLVDWIGTQRLLFNDLIDNENAIRVLQAEAATSGGLLHIDTAPHFILYGE